MHHFNTVAITTPHMDMCGREGRELGSVRLRAALVGRMWPLRISRAYGSASTSFGCARQK
eukprot:432357-Pelagomonas_calceolata.AAC.1